MLQTTSSASGSRYNRDIRSLHNAFDEHRDELKRTIVRTLDQRVQPRTDPSDVLHEAFIEAIRTHDRFVEDMPMPLFDWLRLLAKNMAKNTNSFHLQTEKRTVKSENQNENNHLWLQNQSSTPSHRAVKSEMLNKKTQCLMKMTVEENEVIRLRHQMGFSNEQVANRLGISAKAASKRYYRAVKKLSQLMDWSSVG